MWPYFPFETDSYTMSMNARAGVESLIEVEPEKYAAQLKRKDEILASDYAYYFQSPSEAESLAWEAIALLLPDMARSHPQHFALATEGERWTWTNRLLDTETVFTLGDSRTLPLPPLDWMGRQVQEDLILMAEAEDGDTYCIGGHLCFGSAWCLDDKMYQSFLRIHEDVPQFVERIGRASDLMMRRLKAGRPTERLNWTISAGDELNLAPKLVSEWGQARQEVTSENAGARAFLRIERQTLSRLEKTRGVLFTIHTYLTSLAEVVADPERLRRLTGVIKGVPAATRDYKGMTAFADALLGYLESRCRAEGVL